MTTLRTYDFSKLEDEPERGSVWVLNTSKGERRGDVVITIARASGLGSDPVVLPATWIPMDLTNVVSRAQLLKDNQFRQALSVGLMRLVNPEDAANLFATDANARAEQARLSNNMLSGGASFQRDSANADAEIFEQDRANEGNIPTPMLEMVQRLETAQRLGAEADETDEQFSERYDQLEADACTKVRNMGEMTTAVYKWIFHKTAKLAPSVSVLSKQLGKK